MNEEFKGPRMKELSKLFKDVQRRAEKIAFEDLLSGDPFEIGYLEQMKGYANKLPAICTMKSSK